MLLQHFLFAIIIIFMPLLNIYGLRILRTTHDPNAKIKAYLTSIAVLWIITGIIWHLYSPSKVFYFQYTIEIGVIIKVVLLIFLLFFLVTTILPLFLLKNNTFKANLKESFKERIYIFPLTKREKYLFCIVAITVGICEEVIFRSFLVTYLYELPLDLSITASFIIAGLIFGISHFHQGINGILSATIVGFLMSYLFVATGSLLLPIIIHAIYDMKILLLARVAAPKST